MGQAGMARRASAPCLALAALALLCWASPASADIEFCPPGEGAGQCAAPDPSNFSSHRGLALDYENGHLYVADEGDNRVAVFEEDGDFLFAFGWGVDTGAAKLETCTEASGCQKGLAGSGAGQFSKPSKIAVDNDAGSPNHRFVYVVDAGNSRVSLFDPTSPPVKFIRSVGSEGSAEGQFESRISIDVGPGGILHVLDNLPLGGLKFEHRLQRFKANGELMPPQCILFEGGPTESIAVDSAGNFWVASVGEGLGIRKYAADCGEVLFAEDSVNSLTLDEAGDLYAVQREFRDKALGNFVVITAYDAATGSVKSRFAYGRIPSAFVAEGLAVRDGGEAGIFVAVREEGSAKRIRRLDYPPPPPPLPSPGPIAAPPSLEIEGLGSAKATLVAEVNPEGEVPTQVHFEYLTQAEFEAQGGFTGPATKKTPTVNLSVPSGREFRLNTAEALAGCPNPQAEAGEPGKCLMPETTYRWRVVATNADGPGEGTVEGEPFTTKKSPELGEIYATKVGTDTARLNGEVNPNGIPASGYFEYVDDAAYQADIEEGGDGFAAAIKAPDEGKGQAPLDFGAGEDFITRQVAIFPLLPGTVYHYRLVADNALVDPKVSEAPRQLLTFEPPEAPPCPENDASRIGPGALLPDCRAYEMVSPLDKAGGDIKVLDTTSGVPGVLEQSSASGGKLAYGSLRAFGGAASAPFTSQYISLRIAGEEWRTHPINPPRRKPIYSATGQFETEFKAFSADLCETWLTTFAEAPLAPGGVAEYSNLYRRTDELCGEGGAAHYETLAPLEAPPGILGEAFAMELLGLSADGKQAVFMANGKLTEEGSGGGTRQLYESVRGAGLRLVCILPGGAPVNGSCTAGSGTLSADLGGAFSSDGERIFWSTPAGGEGKIYVRIGGTQTIPVSEAAEKAVGASKSWFWGSVDDGSKAIFSTEVEPGVSNLYEFDVEEEETDPIAEGVRGVMGMSADASRIYFASNNVLSESANSNGDKAVADKANLYLHEAGEGGGSTEFIATLANLDLTSNISQELDIRRTARVSPDGAHAAFASVAPLTGYDNKGADSGVATQEIYRYDAAADELVCVSCNPSGARPAGPATIPFLETNMHGRRILSEDGNRLYFQSADTLAARDTNGRVDVYQWEEPGAGGCDEADAAFSAPAGGCVELISSGQSPQDSRFVEAGPSGDDVFFATVASLLPQDFGLFDIYDARVDGGLPIPPPRGPECEGDACHAQIPSPEEPTAASSVYVAPPRAPGSARKRCAKDKRRVSVKGKSRCVPKRKRHHRRAKR
jgi:hypothetical protein